MYGTVTERCALQTCWESGRLETNYGRAEEPALAHISKFRRPLLYADPCFFFLPCPIMHHHPSVEMIYRVFLEISGFFCFDVLGYGMCPLG